MPCIAVEYMRALKLRISLMNQPSLEGWPLVDAALHALCLKLMLMLAVQADPLRWLSLLPALNL